MAITILRGTASVRLRIPLDATGLTSSSAGLIISTICDNEATATVYTQAAGNIETISAIGTYAAPSSGKIRFAEVDATNHPGLYEIQIADARLNVTNSRTLVITCSGAGLPATGINYEIDLEGGGTIIVQPIVGSTPERTAGATIRTFNGENYPATVSGVDAQGNVIDWTTLSNLEFVIDDQEGTDLAVIADANITKQTTFFSVVIPAAANIVPTGRNSIAYRWSVRNATSKVVILQGQVIVTRTALID
jgi:hypothetical protein